MRKVECPFYDTVGESFELNVAAAQEAGTFIGTAKPIILRTDAEISDAFGSSTLKAFRLLIPAKCITYFRVCP